MDRRLLLSRLFFVISLLWIAYLLKPLLPLLPLLVLSFLLTALLSFINLLIVAERLIPLPEEDRFRVQFRMVRFLLKRLLSINPACFYVSQGRVEERIRPGRWAKLSPLYSFIEKRKRIREWSRLRRLMPMLYFNKNGIIWVDSDSVAAMQAFIYPSRLLNPSTVFANIRVKGGELAGDSKSGFPIGFTRMYERIKAVLDLRPHRKRGVVRAITRDGVEVKVELTLDISLSHPHKNGDPANPYPFDPKKVLRVAYIEAQAEEEPVDWVGRAFSIAANALSQVISRYNLCQLYNYPSDATRASYTPTRFLEEELEALLTGDPRANRKGLLDDTGVTLLELRLGPIRVPVEVLEQTVAEWEAGLEAEQIILEAEADAAFWKEMEEAQAQAIRDIAENVFRSFVELEREGLSQEIIVFRLIKALEELASHPTTRRMLSRQARDRLTQIGLLKGLTWSEEE